MTKAEAVDTIINDARANKGSKTSLKRLRRAMKALDLAATECIAIEQRLNYRSYETAELYKVFQEAK